MTNDAKAAAMPASRLGVVLIVLLTVLWGVNWPVMKIGLNALPPLTFRGAIVPVGGALLLLLARLGGLAITIRRDQWKPLLIAALFNVTGWHTTSAFGISFMESGRASVIAFTMPVWSVLMSVFFFDERLSGRTMLALVCGLGGIGILLGGDIATLGRAPLGPLFMLASAVLWAAGTVYQKKIDWAMPVLTLTAWQLLLGSLPIVGLALFYESPGLAAFTPAALGAIAFNIVGPLCFCYYAWFKIVDLYPATVAGVSTLMVPVIGVISGGLALGEPLGLGEIAALALVGSAIVLVLIVPKTPAT